MSDILNKVSADLYEYQPGNCTRYYILATVIEPSGFDSASLAFMWLLRGDRGGQGMLIPLDDLIDLKYFQEKTGIKNTADAVPLLCFLAEHFGLPIAGIPVEYNKDTWFQGAKARVEDSGKWCR